MNVTKKLNRLLSEDVLRKSRRNIGSSAYYEQRAISSIHFLSLLVYCTNSDIAWVFGASLNVSSLHLMKGKFTTNDVRSYYIFYSKPAGI